MLADEIARAARGIAVSARRVHTMTHDDGKHFIPLESASPILIHGSVFR